MHTISKPLQELVTLTPVHESDAEELVALRIDAMRDSLTQIGRFDPDRARSRFLSGFSARHTRHINTQGTRIGFVVVKPEPGALLLDHLYLRPGSQGQHIGSIVLTGIIEEANSLGLPLRVGALRGSAANRFYMRHGFILLEQQEFDNYYLRPRDTAP